MTFSACYIVKNEAHTLARSIASLKGICQEVIVVDTGSTDNTMQVAQEAGATVLQFAWVDDFAAARNFAISHATGDIIICIDADEYFEPALGQRHVQLLQKAVDKGEYVFDVRMINRMKNGPASEMYLIRMFCNHRGIHYQNAIHEQLNDWQRQCFLPEEFTLIHTGYMGDTTAKTKRNLELLRRQLDPETDTAENPVMYFYIAREAGQLKEWRDAAKYIDKFFTTMKKERLLFPIHLMIAVHRLRLRLALLEASSLYTGRERETFVEEYVRAYPAHPIPWLMKGIYEFEFVGDYHAAEEAFARMERMQEAYDPQQFPGDFVSAESERMQVWMARGAMAAQRGDRGGAFDCYIRLLQGGYSPLAMHELLGCVDGQPAADCVALLRSLVDMQSSEMLEKLMNALIYYPRHRELYMYCAKLHIQQSNAYSDLTAIVSILIGQYAHAIKVAGNLQQEGYTQDALTCTALFCSMEASLLEGLTLSKRADKLARAYFAGEALGEVTAEEWQLLSIICRQMLFIGKKEALERMREMLRSQLFMRYMIWSSYAYTGGHFEDVVEDFDLDEGAFTPLQAAYCYLRLGRAYAGLQQYGEALRCYRAALEKNHNYPTIARDLHIIASVSEEYAAQATRLINQYSLETPPEFQLGEEENAAFLAVRSVFVGPEQGRLLLLL